MDRMDIEFLNGYLKSTLRMAKKISESKSLKEAKRIAKAMEKKAYAKLEETMQGL